MRTETPICRLCGKPADEDDYCHGCGAYIHEDCEGKPWDPPIGNHDPIDHQTTE